MNMMMKDLHCAHCGVEITWSPCVRNGQPYCCLDCAEGRECLCDYPPAEDDDLAGSGLGS